LSKEVFVRKATGLTRPFGLLDTFIIAASMLNMGSGMLLVFSSSLAFGPSYNFVLSMFLALVMNIFVGVTYAMMTTAMPRSGGDYVFVSRTINAPLGFANNFFWTVVSILGIAWNCLFMAGTAVSASLLVGGSVLNSDYLRSLGQAVTQPTGAFIIGVVTMLFIMVLLILPAKLLKVINLAAFAIGMIAVVAWIVVLAITPTSTFIANFNNFAQAYTNNPNSYEMMINAAKSNGLTISTDWNAVWGATLASLPISYFTLGGANIVNFFSGEIKDAGRTSMWAIVGSLIFVFAFGTLLGAVLFNSAGYEFMAALSYLAFNVPTNYALPTPPYIPLIVSIASPNMAMVLLTLVGMICWLYLISMAYYLIATRNLFAWSYDGVLPTWFSETHKKFYTPVRSVVTITILGIIGLAIYDYYSLAFSFTNFTTAFNTCWLIPCLAAAVFPFVKKNMFEAQPGFVKKRLAGIPMITILGILGALSVVWMDVLVYLNPGYAGIAAYLKDITLAVLFVIFAVGLVFFFAAKAAQKSRGLDLSLVFKEIPPS